MVDSLPLDWPSELMLTARRLVAGLYAGEHPARQAGPGIEFHDYRPYAAGDDPAAIDWRVYGRTDRFYLRRHEHHSDLPAVLCVDTSASMDWPRQERDPGPFRRRPSAKNPRHKLDHARQLAAALALLLTRQGDPLALAAGAGRLDHWLAMGAGPAHCARVGELLDQARPGEAVSHRAQAQRGQPQGKDRDQDTTDAPSLAGLLDEMAARLEPRSLVMILSDWLDAPGPTLEAAGRLMDAGHEILALQLLAPAELSLDRLRSGAARLIDPETGVAAEMRHAPGETAAAYRRALDQHLAALRHALIGPRSDHALLCTDQPAAANLRQVLIARAGSGF